MRHYFENKIKGSLKCNSQMPKKAADKKFQIQNNLAPVSIECNQLK